MVLALGNDQIWLGTPPVVLQFILVFFSFYSFSFYLVSHAYPSQQEGSWANPALPNRFRL